MRINLCHIWWIFVASFLIVAGNMLFLTRGMVPAHLHDPFVLQVGFFTGIGLITAGVLIWAEHQAP